MSVLLVNASTSLQPREADACMAPITLLFLSSYLLKHGHAAEVLDLTVVSDPEAELKKYLSNNSHPIIGFTAETENRFLVRDLISATRKQSPDSLLVVGGNHFTFTAQETLENIPEVDIVVRLGGEETLLEIVKARKAKKGIEDITGISYRNNSEIKHNPKRLVDRDLDKFIITDQAYSHIIQPNAKATYSPFMVLRNYNEENLKALSLHVGRGCPGKCVYCIYNKKQYRGRSAISVVEEIKQGIERHNCHAFSLYDPYLAKRKDFVKDFCRLIKDENLEIKWYTELRADMDMSLLPMMRESGLISVDFGMESASPRVLEAIGKQITVEQSSQFIHRCNELGIRVMAFSMVSLPDEQEEDALLTLRFLEDHWQMLAASYLAVTKIYPGTTLEAMARERGILPDSFSWYDPDCGGLPVNSDSERVPIWREHLSPEFIQYFQERILMLLYSRRPFLREAMSKAIPFLTDWTAEGIDRKARWLGTAKKYLVDWPLLKLKR